MELGVAFTGTCLIQNVLLIRQLIQHREQMERFLLEGSGVSCTTRKARDDEIESRREIKTLLKFP